MKTSTGNRAQEPMVKRNVRWGRRQKQELLGTKALGYLILKELKEIELNRPGIDVAEKNENTYVELIQFLNELSLGLVMTEVKDNEYECLRIYAGHSKPRIIISLKMESESVTEISHYYLVALCFHPEKNSLKLEFVLMIGGHAYHSHQKNASRFPYPEIPLFIMAVLAATAPRNFPEMMKNEMFCMRFYMLAIHFFVLVDYLGRKI